MFFLSLIIALLPQQSSTIGHQILLSREECQCPGRSIWDLLWSCLGTMFICLWTAIHPNIPGPDDTGWMTFKRRVQMMIYAFLAPEVMVMWAMRQAINARKIAIKFNAARGYPEPSNVGLWRMLWGLLLDVIEAVKTWFRGPNQCTSLPGAQWTMTHGFFIQMGGFMLYKDGRPWYTVSYEELERLIGLGRVDVPAITEAQIKDKSKGDFLSKSLILLQSTWFVVQSAARWRTNLPLSKLEVITLAFAALNWFTYAVWWNKPHNVQTPIPIFLKPSYEEKQISVRQEPDDGSSEEEESDPVPIETIVLQPEEPSVDSNKPRQEEQEDEIEAQPQPCHRLWFTRHVIKDYNRYHNRGFFPMLWFILWRLPYRMMSSFLRPFDKMAGSEKIPLHAQRVPMYYASKVEDVEDNIIVWIAVFTSTSFGAFHCLAWSSTFPSSWQLWLWRTSSLAMVALPPAVLLTSLAIDVWDKYENSGHLWSRLVAYLAGTVTFFLCLLFFVLVPGYVAARFVVLIQAFISLHSSSSPLTFQAIQWTEAIPHIR